LYAYVDADPIDFYDPEGLRKSGAGGKGGGHHKNPGTGKSVPNCPPCASGTDKRSFDYTGAKNVYELSSGGAVHKVGIGSGESDSRCRSQARRLSRSTGKQWDCNVIKFICGTQAAEKYEHNRQTGLRSSNNPLNLNQPRRRAR
jgi:hypothetical protein